MEGEEEGKRDGGRGGGGRGMEGRDGDRLWNREAEVASCFGTGDREAKVAHCFRLL